jgi:hypothetical protein
LSEALSLLTTAAPHLVYEQCPTGFYEVNGVDPIETYCVQLDAELLILVAIENWRQN